MLRSHHFFPAASALLLAVCLPLAAAHGDDEAHSGMDMHAGMSMHKNASFVPAVSSESEMMSYFAYPDHKGALYAHVGLMVLAWVVVLPLAIAFSIARSRYTLPLQLAFLLAHGFALLTGTVYNHSTPDLYENNAHHKSGWVFTWMAVAWIVMGLLDLYSGKSGAKDRAAGGQAMSAALMAQYERIQATTQQQETRWSNDSGQGTERNSESLFGGHSRSPSVGSENQHFSTEPKYDEDEDEDDEDDEDEEILAATAMPTEGTQRRFLSNTRFDSFLTKHVPRFAFGRTLAAVRLVNAFLARILLPLGFVGFMTGAAVYGGIARGNHIFNALAHFIKGGIFFWYGLLTLGRWMGAFAEFGWAWNIKPSASIVGRVKAAMPSAEFTESAVICAYGASNVFLEHLGGWGGEWSATDLEHVSITILFFGGGLLGMLIESHWFRDLLNTHILLDAPLTHSAASPAVQQPEHHHQQQSWQEPKTYRFSLNPMPGLIILLLGIMMGSHHQDSMVSTMIHQQWGSMFVGFALARGVTYIMMFISPPTSYLPSRPPSELVSAFCLMAGGIIFVESNIDTVAALEMHGLDAMFTFTISMGLTAILMAWAVVVVASQGWAVRREVKRVPQVAAV